MRGSRRSHYLALGVAALGALVLALLLHIDDASGSDVAEIAGVSIPLAAVVTVVVAVFAILLYLCVAWWLTRRHLKQSLSDTRDDLALSREMLAGVLTATPDGIVIIDQDAKIVSVNGAFERIFGYRREEAVGRNVNCLMPGEMAANHDSYIARYLRTGEAKIIGTGRQVTARRRDGSTFPADIAVGEIVVAGRHFFAGSVRDITKRVEMEELLRRQSRLEAIGQLASGISHDFNNFLWIIDGNLALLEGHLPDDEAPRGYLHDAKDACETGSELIRHLMAYLRKQPLETQEVDIGLIASDMEDLLRRTLGREARFELSVESDIWPVEADPTEIETAILNLVLNARDAIDREGKIEVSVGNRRFAGNGRVTKEKVEAGDYVEIVVRDNGGGVPPDSRDHIFEPFFTTKPLGQGTGLGLSRVQGFVKQSGGHIVVESTVGAGSTFRILLPALARDSADQEATSVHEIRAARRAG